MSILGKMLGFGRNEHYDRAIRLFDQGLFEEAIAEFELSRSTGRKDPLTDRLAHFYTAEAHANLGQAALKRASWERAEDQYREALKIHPHYADLHFSLALCLRRQLRYDDALASLDEALTINPRFAKAHLHKGITLYAAGKHDEAVESLCSALEFEPGFGTEAFFQGMALHKEANFAGALHAWETVSVTEVDDILFHFRLGDDLYRRGKYYEAIEEYGKALELNDRYADIHNHLGLAYSAIDRSPDAALAYIKALEINPSFLDARLNLAITYREMGQNKDAAECFRQVLSLDPDHPLAKANLEEMEMLRAA